MKKQSAEFDRQDFWRRPWHGLKIRQANLLMMGLITIVSLLFPSCNNWSLFDKSVPKGETKVNVDMAAIKAVKNEAKEAFAEGSQEEIDAMCFDEVRSVFTSQYTKEDLEAIGSYLEKAKLTSYSAVHAEYTYKVDKLEYTFAMGIDGDGNWKIVRY